jgi:hypothetical protein
MITLHHTPVYLDIETLPAGPADPLWRRRAGQLSDEAEDRRLDTSLDPMYGRIACVGVAVADGPVHMLGIDGQTVIPEEITLGSLVDLLGAVDAPELITWRGHSFDLPFLQTRLMRHGMPTMDWLLGAPGRQRPGVDLAEIWPTTHRRVAQWEACAHLGIPLQGGIMGADVHRAYVEGRVSEIGEHCAADVEQLRALAARMVIRVSCQG